MKLMNKVESLSIPPHKHMVDHVKQFEDGGHKHHMNFYKPHSAGHMMEHDKVQKLCGGGMTGKK
jgi:hypothetical protein